MNIYVRILISTQKVNSNLLFSEINYTLGFYRSKIELLFIIPLKLYFILKRISIKRKVKA